MASTPGPRLSLGPRSIPRISSLLHALTIAIALAAFAIVDGLEARAAGQDPSDEIFYHFMPICWRDSNGDPERFGDFGGMTASLPYLQYLGVTAVWMNPVFPSPAYHGYQHGRADSLNPRFGTEAEFTAFLEAAHQAGIKVFVDLVAYEISHDSPWFDDAFANPGSAYDDWLAFTNSANTSYQGGTYTTWNGDTVGDIFWDLRHPSPVALVTGWAQYWLDPNGDGNFADGLDGYRLDHVWSTYPNGPDGWGYHIDTFWAPWRDALRSVNPDVFVFAEQADWGSQGVDLLAGLDAAFTKPFEFGARDALRWEYAEPLYAHAAAAVAAVDASPHPGALLATIGNHDVDRLASSIGSSFAKGKVAAAVLLTQPFAPVLYHGDEIGMRGTKNTGYSGDAADIPMREPFKWNAVAGPPMSNYHVLNPAAYAGSISQDNDGRSVEEQQGNGGSLLEAYRGLIAVRKASIALRRGDYAPVPASDGAVWAFVRHHDDQQVLVVLHLAGDVAPVTLDLSAFAIPGGTTQPTDLIGGPNPVPLTTANRDAWPLTLGSYGYVIYDLDIVPPAPPASVVDGLAIPTDFGPSALLATQDSPTHLGDNVTELDQLFARIAGDSLHVGVTGNLATDGTGLAVLLDVHAGGQTVLDLSAHSPPPSGPAQLTGLALDPGFEPDVLLFLNAFSGTLYLDRFDLLGPGSSSKTYLGQGTVGSGEGLLAGGTNPYGAQFALDNSNTSGVTGSDVSQAAGAVTGAEAYFSLEDLGWNPSGAPVDSAFPVAIAAFALESDGTVSNQWLPPVGGVGGPLGLAPDMTSYAGDQFAVITEFSGLAVQDPAGGTPSSAPGIPVLHGAEPNPSRDGATIRFELPRAGTARLTIFDVTGRQVRLLVNGSRDAGVHAPVWDGRDDAGRPAAPGVYFARLDAGEFTATRKVVRAR